MKKYNIVFLLAAAFFIGLTGCQKGNLQDNPNVSSTNSTVPPTLILNRITNEIYYGGGVMDGVSGNQNEGPWNQIMRWNQFFVSNYSYYWGPNAYTWSSTATMSSVLKYVELLESQSTKQLGAANVYTALSKFFRAYLFIWYSQRVGDIPMSQAGNTSILAPKYDSQHDVYKNCLALLDTANTMMAALVTPVTSGTKVDANGDIFGLTYLGWQKVINTYKLRVLISLSKRAQDNADLNIPSQFATIVNNPTKYPVLTGNTDNLAYKYLSSPSKNNYPLFPNYTPYINYSAMCGTFMNLVTANKDPRTFIASTPAPSLIGSGKSYTDFAAYTGADIDLTQSVLLANSNSGLYSYNNYLRYYGTSSGPNVSGSTCEPYVIIGYAEMCFNIAEAANRGWIPGTSGSAWYTQGIMASMNLYGLADGTQITVGMPIISPSGNNYTNVLGPVTVSVSNFLAQPGVVYAGDNANGLTQILQQKYVAFWQNSGWEAYYNWRRTGVPTFQQGGTGIGTSSLMIPIRWQYPNDEAVANTVNYQSALASQYGGSDDVTKPMWLIK